MKLSDTDQMPFGKYQGEPMMEVPASYFNYLWHNGLKDKLKSITDQGSVANYINDNIDAFKMENKDLIWK